MKRMYRFSSLLLLGLFLFFMGCSDSSSDKKEEINEFKLAADLGDAFLNGSIKLIDATTLYNDLQGGSTDYYLLDIRAQADYESGHISGAVLMSAADITDNLASIPSDKKIVVICYTGQGASQVSTYLNAIGYDSYALKFGMCGWTTDASVNKSNLWKDLVPTDAALETTPNDITTQTENAYPTLNTGKTSAIDIYKARMDAYLDAGMKHVAAASVWPNLSDYFIIDLRQETHYNNGHVPGAFRVAQSDLGYGESLKYLPTDKKIMVICYTAHQSDHVVSYLNTLGYDAYNFKYGMNAVTSNTDICKVNYSAPAQNYPVVTGATPTGN